MTEERKERKTDEELKAAEAAEAAYRSQIPFRWMPREHAKYGLYLPSRAVQARDVDRFILYVLNREPPITREQWQRIHKGKPDTDLWLEFQGKVGAEVATLNARNYYNQGTDDPKFGPFDVITNNMAVMRDHLKLTPADFKTMLALKANNAAKWRAHWPDIEPALFQWQHVMDTLVDLTEKEQKLLDALPPGLHRLTPEQLNDEKYATNRRMIAHMRAMDPARSKPVREAFLAALREQAEQVRRIDMARLEQHQNTTLQRYGMRGRAASGTPFDALSGAAATSFARYIYAPKGSDERKKYKAAHNDFMDRRRGVRISRSKPPLPFTQTTPRFTADGGGEIYRLTNSDYGVYDADAAATLLLDKQAALAAFEDDDGASGSGGFGLQSGVQSAGAAGAPRYTDIDDVD
jgi:hypothetical protein